MAVPSCATIQVLEGENMRLREAQVDAESKTARAVQEVADYRDAVRELRSEQRLAWLHFYGCTYYGCTYYGYTYYGCTCYGRSCYGRA